MQFSRKLTHSLPWMLPAILAALCSVPCSAQIGTAEPQASGHVQVQTKVNDKEETAEEEIGHQALDVDAAALSQVPADPYFKHDPFQFIVEPVDKDLNRLRKLEGLTFGATYTLLNQYATSTPDSVRHNWATGRFDLVGDWKAYDHGGSAGSISMLVRSGTNIGVSEKFNLSDSLGSGLVLNCLPGGGPQRPITLNILYYRQDFLEKKFAFYIGKIHPNEFISLSLYNNDERTQFLNAENDGNLTIPSDGTYAGGAALEYQATSHIYVHLVTIDTEGGQERNLKTLADKKYMNAVELGWKSGTPSRQEHLFRAVVWRDDTATQGSGAGFGFGSDYETHSGWTPFGRIGLATNSGTTIRRILDVGLAQIRPFGRTGDMFGAAINLSEPSRGHGYHHEAVFETFYRIRLTQSLDMGPDLEVSVHPMNHPQAYTTAVLGARMRLIF